MMLTSFIFINVAICLLLIRLKWSRRSPFFVFFVVLLVFIIIPTLFDETGEYFDFHAFANPVYLDYWMVAESQLFITLFLLFFLMLEVVFPAPQRANHYTEGQFRTPQYLVVLPMASFLIAGLGYYILGPLMTYVNFAASQEFGLVSQLNLLTFYLAVLSSPLPAVFLSERRIAPAMISFASLLIPIIAFGAARQAFFISIISLIFLLIHHRKHAAYIFTGAAIIFLPAAEFALDAIKVVRNLPDLSSRISALTDLSTLTEASQATSGESAIRYVFYQLLAGASVESSGQFQYLLRTYLFWMPSFVDVLDIKPDDFERKIFSAVMGGREGSMHPTVFGAILADSGWFMMPWIATIFLYMRVVEASIARNAELSSFLFYFSFYPSVMMARGSLYAPVVITFLVLSLVVARSLLERKQK